MLTLRVGRDGVISHENGVWMVTSTRPGLGYWQATRATLWEAEEALAEAHAGNILPEDFPG